MTLEKPSKIVLEEVINKVTPDGVKSVMKLIEQIITAMEKEVIVMDLNTKSFSQLAIAKAKADGARLLFNRLEDSIKKAAKRVDSDSL